MSVRTKIVLLPTFFILAILLTILFTVLTVNSQRRDAVVIEINGRQRMLHERHFKEVLLVASGEATRESLAETRKVVNGTQEALIRGGEVQAKLGAAGTLELPGAPSGEIRATLEDQQRLMKDFEKAADAYLQPDTAENVGRTVTVQELMELNEQIQQQGVNAAKQLTAHTLRRSEQLIISEIIIGSVVALAGLLLSWTITSGVIPPMQQLVLGSSRISEGDLRGQDIPVTGSDEIGQLTQTFNKMLGNLKELNGQIRSVAANINSASAEILASTQEQAASTKEQAATVQEITATMQQISQSGVDISDKAKVVAASAEATSTASKSGFEAVRNTTRLMDGIRTQVEEVAEKIVALSEKTQAVGEIISTVNEVAEQ
ncbi:MAG: methyl-accepting chemotaxis protein, partial [Chthoniobacteraceae bacterium]